MELQRPLLEAAPWRRERLRRLQRPAAAVAALSAAAALLALCTTLTRRLRDGGSGGLAAPLGGPRLDEVALLQSMQLAPSVMRVLEPMVRIRAAAAPLPTDTKEHLPVVILHGMGDSGTNPGMQHLCNSVGDAFPGVYVMCSNVANGLSSITAPLAEQVDEFSRSVRADAQLANGFHAVGLSQGGLVLRGYVQQRKESDPQVRRLVSVCAPHGGIGSCPTSPAYRMVCPLWKLAPYTARLAFADYWKDASDQATYLERSRWLADMNNERKEKKASYKDNLLKLDRYVLVEATNDSTVVPYESESHGFYAWGGTSVQTLRETEGYKGDYLGLKTLDESGRLVVHTYNGDHLQFSAEFWASKIVPHLGA